MSDAGELLAIMTENGHHVKWLVYEDGGVWAACYLDGRLLRRSTGGEWWMADRDGRRCPVGPGLLEAARDCVPDDVVAVWPEQAPLLPYLWPALGALRGVRAPYDHGAPSCPSERPWRPYSPSELCLAAEDLVECGVPLGPWAEAWLVRLAVWSGLKDHEVLEGGVQYLRDEEATRSH